MRTHFPTNKFLLLAGIFLILACAASIYLLGRTFTIEVEGSSEMRVEIEHDCVRLMKDEPGDGVHYLTFESVHSGKTFVDVYSGDEFVQMFVLYVHSTGVITYDTFFGTNAGSRIIPVAIILFLALLLWRLIGDYRRDIRADFYQHKNVRNLGLIIFLFSLMLSQFQYVFRSMGLEDAVRSIITSANGFAIFVFPAAFIAFLLVTVSNIQLMRKEGWNWRNMLGAMLGILLCVMTVFPDVLENYLQYHQTVIDVHNEKGILTYVLMAVQEIIFIIVTYLECILISSIIHAVRAAKHVPSFDQDYMLILGCQIQDDGSLTNLLKGRADKAIRFARQQEEKTGKKLVFVPSGGQGSDEVMSEGEAIRNYLVSVGIPEKQILVEDQSKNTYENLRNSAALIRKRQESLAGKAGNSAGPSAKDTVKIAFSTTNYHVFRSGILASEQGIHAEGIGARTKSYFWINAFIREFIANMYSEYKTHIKILLTLVVLIIALIGLVYISILL
ncbi:MAG: YdcF family protein [Firmicutes bacterium]|nr:YdcF family protein [Bacillota bacterium]